MDRLVPGTRVVAEGPFGVFTEASRTQEKVLLVAGGIGITPIRALIEEMEGDIVVLYRVVSEEDLDLQRRARRGSPPSAGSRCTTWSATTRRPKDASSSHRPT